MKIRIIAELVPIITPIGNMEIVKGINKLYPSVKLAKLHNDLNKCDYYTYNKCGKKTKHNNIIK